MAKSSTNRMKRRINIILAGMILVCFTGLIFRLYYLQIHEGEKYQRMALNQQMRSTSISANRGAIYDRNMKLLAQSADVFTVVISPNDIADDAERNLIANALSEILDVDREMVLRRSNNTGSYYERIKSKVDNDTADLVTQFAIDNKLTSVYLEGDTKRYYPYGTLASTVLGFTGDGNKGAYGLEAYYESTLGGTDGMVVTAKNARGTDMDFRYTTMYEAEDGNSIVLTIDEVIQHYLEKNLEMAVTEHNVGNRASGIVYNIKTGEILAMATKGDFDPNDPWTIQDPKAVAQIEELKEIYDKTQSDEARTAYNDALREAQYVQWSNKAVSEPYEPGSVFKLITAAAALESGTVTPTGEHFNCPGYHMVAGNRIACWKAGGHGSINFAEAIKFSCNPTFMMVGQRLGADRFYNFRELFGFHELTGIDLPGEAEANLHSLALLQDKNMASLSSSSFGQTFKVTPIQMMTSVSASIGGGKLMQPYVVSQVLDKDGNVISSTSPVVKRQAISEETSRLLAQLAEAVIGDSDGSGRKSYIPGYRVGGKTGTSQKIDEKDPITGEIMHILSFYAFAPVDDPTVAVLVMLDEPADGGAYGSTIAAPVVGSILTDVLPYMGFEPSYTQAELEAIDVQTPYLIGQNPHDAQSALTQVGLKNRIIGSGTRVVRQVPGAGEPIPRGGTVILYTEADTELDTATVPNVIGMSGSEANRTILNSGLNIRVSGESIQNASSLAIDQSPAPGTKVNVGTVVTVTFTNKDVEG